MRRMKWVGDLLARGCGVVIDYRVGEDSFPEGVRNGGR